MQQLNIGINYEPIMSELYRQGGTSLLKQSHNLSVFHIFSFSGEEHPNPLCFTQKDVFPAGGRKNRAQSEPYLFPIDSMSVKGKGWKFPPAEQHPPGAALSYLPLSAHSPREGDTKWVTETSSVL